MNAQPKIASRSRLNLSWVSEQLAVGGSFQSSQVPHLARELRVRHVVDLRVEAKDDEGLLRSHGMELLHLPARDHFALVSEQVDRGLRWVAPRIERKERVYVHCEHGLGRSVLFTMCMLVHMGDAPLGALERIKRARPCASPSPAQLHAFLRWCEPRCGDVPGWHDLARIAYRGVGLSESP